MNRNPVRAGMPILLIVIGLVLALAVADRLDGLDLTMIGWILGGVGLVWLVIELVMGNKTRSVASATTRQVDPNTGSSRTEVDWRTSQT